MIESEHSSNLLEYRFDSLLPGIPKEEASNVIYVETLGRLHRVVEDLGKLDRLFKDSYIKKECYLKKLLHYLPHKKIKKIHSILYYSSPWKDIKEHYNEILKQTVLGAEREYRTQILESFSIQEGDKNSLSCLLDRLNSDKGDKEEIKFIITCEGITFEYVEEELIRKLRYKSRDWDKSLIISDAYSSLINNQLENKDIEEKVKKNVIKYVDFVGINNSNIYKIFNKKIESFKLEGKVAKLIHTKLTNFLDLIADKLKEQREKPRDTNESESTPKIAITYTQSGGAHLSIYNTVKKGLTEKNIPIIEVDESSLVPMQNDTLFQCVGIAHADVYNIIGQQKGEMEYAKNLKKLDDYLKIFIKCIEPACFREKVEDAKILYSASNHPRNVTFVADKIGRKVFFQLCDYGELSDKLRWIAKAVVKYSLENIFFLAPSERTTLHFNKKNILATVDLLAANEDEMQTLIKTLLSLENLSGETNKIGELIQSSNWRDIKKLLQIGINSNENDKTDKSKYHAIKAKYHAMLVTAKKIILFNNHQAEACQSSHEVNSPSNSLPLVTEYRKSVHLRRYPVSPEFHKDYKSLSAEEKNELLSSFLKADVVDLIHPETTRIWVMTMGRQGVGGILDDYLSEIVKQASAEIAEQANGEEEEETHPYNILILVLCGNNKTMLQNIPNYFKTQIENIDNCEDLKKKIVLKAIPRLDPSDIAVLGQCCHVFLSKPGGGTSAEALAGGFPLAIHREDKHYWEFGNIEELKLAGAKEVSPQSFYKIALEQSAPMKRPHYPKEEVADFLHVLIS